MALVTAVWAKDQSDIHSYNRPDESGRQRISDQFSSILGINKDIQYNNKKNF